MRLFILALAITLAVSGTVVAQDKTHEHMSGMKHGAETASVPLPEEGGQAAFAALQEVVELLDANPNTDWSKVDIEALRQHLIDMNNVTLGAAVVGKQEGNAMTFTVSGDGAVRQSIRRMIVGHVAAMNGVDGWAFTAQDTENGAVMDVTPPDPSAMPKLRALGFIGIMTLGMHHQQHHWMMANRMGPHQ
jgi:hypothetical protein